MNSLKERVHRVRVWVAKRYLRFRVGYGYLRVRVANEYQRADLFRAQGARIGSGYRLLIHYLGSEPYLICIGDETLVSSGVTFVTHDGGTWAIEDLEDWPVNRYGRITIGSRCFIGTGSILLPCVTIGDRAVVGAGSVVTKDVAAGTVVAGVPARFICTSADYRAKCVAESLPDVDTSSMKAKRRDLERLIQASNRPLNGADRFLPRS